MVVRHAVGAAGAAGMPNGRARKAWRAAPPRASAPRCAPACPSAPAPLRSAPLAPARPISPSDLGATGARVSSRSMSMTCSACFIGRRRGCR